jgi:ADP-heptose:LPS heptosyltransferase
VTDGPAPQVLVLRALGLGDGLTAVPALRGLRRLAAGRELLLACAHPVADLLRAHGVVDTVLPTTGLDGVPPGLGVGRHVAVNLHGRGPQSHRLLVAGEPEALVAFACPEAGVAGPPWRDDEHEVARWCRLVTSAGGACGSADLPLGAPGDRSGPVVLHPGAASAARRWPVDRWAAVGRELRAAGHDVVVTGSGDAEARAAAEVAREAGLPAAADLSGRLDLPALSGLVRQAQLVLCGDTGVAHLASAWATPSVVLFGPLPPTLWGPPRHARHAVLRSRDGGYRGDPHGAVPDPALLEITVDDVLHSAAGVLRAATGDERGQDDDEKERRRRPAPLARR